MFRYSCILILMVIPSAFNQFITFKDGKFGVNFAGYHAEAGLGGLLTGNAAHGGLSASAGTPFGQRAGAGIGGTVNDGQTRGGAFAGASAGYGVGASAALGGDVNEHGGFGGLGSEAHAGGISTKTVKLSRTPEQPQIQQQTAVVKQKEIIKNVQPLPNIDQRSAFAQDVPAVEQQLPGVQYNKRFYKRKFVSRQNGRKNKRVEVDKRIYQAPQSYQQPQNNFDYRNFFDFGYFSNAGASFSGAPQPNNNGHVINVQKQLSPNTLLLHKTVLPAPQTHQVKVDERFQDDDFSSEASSEVVKSKSAGTATYTSSAQWQPNPNFFNDIFNIPISTLGAVNQFLNNGAGGGVAVTKTKTVNVDN